MTLNWKGKITKILVLLPQGRSWNMPQKSTMDTEHSWDPEKKASGVQDMQPIMVASGIFVRQKCWKFLRNQDIRFSKDKSAWPWNHGSIATLTWCIGLFIPRTSSVSTEQSQSGVERSKPKQTRKCSQDVSRNSNKTGRSQVIGGYSKTTACIGKPNAPEFEGLRLDAIVQRRTSTIRSRKKTSNVTTTLDDDGLGKRTSMCNEYTAPRNREYTKP